jgi:hypothetical protein
MQYKVEIIAKKCLKNIDFNTINILLSISYTVQGDCKTALVFRGTTLNGLMVFVLQRVNRSEKSG